jgi:hypothetical protein
MSCPPIRSSIREGYAVTDEELRTAYEEQTEAMQSLCEQYGALGGENRLLFLQRQLWAYKSALQEIRGSRGEHYHWEVAEYALAGRRKP